MRVFLDANVLFAASNPGSPTARLVRLLLDQGTAVTCGYAHEEARRNVDLKWPHHAAGLAALMPRIEMAPTRQFVLAVNLVDKDVPILCSAIRARCDYLATGDKRDFGHLYGQTVEGVTVITLLRLAELLTRSNS